MDTEKQKQINKQWFVILYQTPIRTDPRPWLHSSSYKDIPQRENIPIQGWVYFTCSVTGPIVYTLAYLKAYNTQRYQPKIIFQSFFTIY